MMGCSGWSTSLPTLEANQCVSNPPMTLCVVGGNPTVRTVGRADGGQDSLKDQGREQCLT